MTATQTGTVEVNGAELYFERRGSGPAVGFIAGGGGSGLALRHAAELLADSYTVVTYDRRGSGRSPGPPGWTTTTVAEQADDCVGLIRALELDRPVIVGHSNGGTVLVGLAQRHGSELGGAVVVEPLLGAVSPSFPRFVEETTALTADALAQGDVDAMWETLNRWMFGEEMWDQFPPDVADQERADGEMNATIVWPAISAFAPDAAALAACPAPVHAVHGADTGPPIEVFVESARWVAEISGGPLHVFPGGHLEGTINPERFVTALRPVLASMREPSAPRT